MTPEQEIWAVALSVEKHHGDDGPARKGDEAGVAMWKKVEARLVQLRRDVPPPH